MNSSIQISKELETLIRTFGSEDDNAETCIQEMYDLAVKTQLREFLLSSENTLTLDEAEKRHEIV
ncbi:MAG: hypothetical protein ACMXYK_02095 [Candidatus Woesearchaeota archaeon]